MHKWHPKTTITLTEEMWKQKCNYAVIALNKKLRGSLNACSHAETDTNQKHQN